MPSVTDLIRLRDEAVAERRDADAADARVQGIVREVRGLDRLRARVARSAADALAALEPLRQAAAEIPAAREASRRGDQALADLVAQIAEHDTRIAAIETEIEQLTQNGQRIPPTLNRELRLRQAARAALEQQRPAAIEQRAIAQTRLSDLEAQETQLALAQARAEQADAALRQHDLRRNQLQLALPTARQEAALLRTSAEALEARLQLALDRLIGGLRTDVPIALLPVRLETRFRSGPAGGPPGDLLIRVYPDDVHSDTHEFGLTDEEDLWGKHFWRQTWKAGTAAPDAPNYSERRTQELAAWQQLATRFGPARAAYVAARLTPLNESARPAPFNSSTNLVVDPTFDANLPQRASSWTRAGRARALPDRWLAVGVRTGQPSHTVWGNLIPAALAIGPDPSVPAPAPGDVLPTIPVDPGMRWMVDFAEAERHGMGIRMPLTVDEAASGFDRLIVIGVKGTLNNPADGATELGDLIDAHRFTWGCGFVPQGTPTNNTERVDSGHSRDDPGYQRSFALERETQVDGAQAESDGAAAARGLGLPLERMTHLRHADGRDQRDASDFNRMLWPVTLGYFLNQIANEVIPGVDLDAWRDYFVRHLRARGPLPALRIGRQPYGLLPVTSLDGWVGSRPDLVDVLRALREVWRASVTNVARVGRSGDAGADLVETLGLEPVSSSYSWRWTRGPRFFELFWQLPGQSLDPAVIDTAKVALGDRLRIALQPFGLSPGQWTRLSCTTFAGVAFDWQGPLVEVDPLSDTASLRHNYLQLLADPGITLTEIHDEGVKLVPAASAKPLLYRLARHATLLAYAEQALPLWPSVPISATDAPWFEPELVDLERDLGGDRPGDPLQTPTFWRVLQTVRGGAAMSLGDELRAKGLGAPAPLQTFLASLQRLSQVPSAALERLLGEALDLCSHRLDAWITSLATSRLDELRAAQPNGIYVGGYGWVENLRPRANMALSDGFVHAPSLAQATTATVLRSAYLVHRDQAAGARLALDLSSKRVRLAKTLIDGVRQGQPLGALLGYRFERALHEGATQLNRFIAPLRELAPLAGGQLVPAEANEPLDAIAADHVVDGLKLLDLYRAGQIPLNDLAPQANERAAIQTALGEINDAVDAIGDLALGESVHQAIQGNYLRAGATLDAISRGEAPPYPLELITTPQSGIGFTQRLVMLRNEEPAPAGDWTRQRARAVAEPVLNAWAETQLGSPTRVRYQAAYFAPDKDPLVDPPVETKVFSLDAIAICALDVVYAPPVADVAQQSDLEMRLARAAMVKRPAAAAADTTVRLVFRRQPGVHDPAHLTLPELFELARVVRELVTNGRPLDARDLAQAGSRGDALTEAPTARMTEAVSLWTIARQTLRALFEVDQRPQLDVLRAAPFNLPLSNATARVNLLDVSRMPGVAMPVDTASVSLALDLPAVARLDDLRAALDAFSAFAVHAAVPTSIGGNTAAVRQELVQQADRVHAQVVEIDRKLAAITGTGVADMLAKAAVLFGEGFRVLPSFTLPPNADLEQALQRRVRAKDAGIADVLPWLHSVAGVRDGARRLSATVTYAEIAGEVTDVAFRVAQWPFDEGDRWNAPQTAAMAAATSLVVQANDGLDLNSRLAGLMVDEWVEVIPQRTLQTAIAVHYDAPGARAPQAILLAVSPDPSKAWDAATLQAIVTETIELSRLRTVDYDALASLGQLLPAIFLATNTGGDPHGDTVASNLGS